jgi:aspartyl/glutamyl-tRNA(Asn/Gln) amidotransferase C subunit
MSLARLAKIHLDSEELASLTKDLEAVLAYASSLAVIAKQAGPELQRDEQRGVAHNVMRDDVVVAYDAQTLLAQAPVREEDYFIVPRILQRT